jgi:cellulose synthase/poly-beta-1,6-N-acetylglucosamine synthase-like glycosyltransferase
MSVVELERGLAPAAEQQALASSSTDRGIRKRPDLFIGVFFAWAAALAWFHPRMWSLTELADGPWAFASIAYFVVFAELAWLYGLYNVGIVATAFLHKRGAQWRSPEVFAPATGAPPAVAVLYTTCNDFVERSALSCVTLNYPSYHVYILDDSSDPGARARIDAFAAIHLDRVTIVRRADRRGFKAGNLNHALSGVVKEPYFAVVDADEILPVNFITGLLPRLLANDKCGFVQANHRSQPDATARLARDMGVGIDIHWKWYQPLRNTYGFVMFLGHGALLRRSCWEEVGGFPEIVSEDLAYAIAIRDQGYFGVFAEDVVCFEEFPETVRAFRIRHVKWTRGTCEFLHRWMGRLVAAKNITIAEKLDVLFPTLNLPMTFFFFLFMVNSQFLFPVILGQFETVTFVLMGQEFTAPVLTVREGVSRIFGIDFYAITLMTIIAPILCFMIELSRKPLRMLRFLGHSTALYAALSPLSFVSVLGYAATRKAQFLVTGDARGNGALKNSGGASAQMSRLAAETHPDSRAVKGFEIVAGLAFLISAVATFQISFIGVALGFILLPIMHTLGWEHAGMRFLAWAPFTMIAAGVAFGALGVAGLQPVFFGFGFHF